MKITRQNYDDPETSSFENMKNALAAMNRSGGRKGKAIAETHGVSYSSLRERFAKASSDKQEGPLKRGPTPDLSANVELMLKSFVTYMHSVNLSMDRMQVQGAALKMA